jgi:branched-chain amino acid transport system ATP-binding protein
MLLKMEKVNTLLGAAHIVFDLDLYIQKGEVVCLLGRNGVGKSTSLRSIMGLAPPANGKIWFKNNQITGLQPYEIARLGIGYVPEDRRIFPDLTVRDNLEIGIKGNSAKVEDKIRRAFQMFPPLERFQDREGGKLSGGQQQMLTIARTLMGEPELLLLDEPTEGLSPMVVTELEASILKLKDEGLTIIMAAPDLQFASRLGDRIYILDRGHVVYHAPVEQVRREESIVKSHLAV